MEKRKNIEVNVKWMCYIYDDDEKATKKNIL